MKTEKAQTRTHKIAMQTYAAMAPAFNSLSYLFTKIIDLLINFPVMNKVWCERRELESLLDTHIKDIGLTPDSVRQEINRSYFDIPNDRKRSYRSVNTSCQGDQRW